MMLIVPSSPSLHLQVTTDCNRPPISTVPHFMAGPYPYPEEEYSRYESPEQEESDDRFGEVRAFHENEFEAQEND